MEAAGAAQEAGKDLEMTRTIILFVDAARERRHSDWTKSCITSSTTSGFAAANRRKSQQGRDSGMRGREPF
jgi:hypothetical protein